MATVDNRVLDFEKEFRRIINDFTKISFAATQEALKTVADETARRLMLASPSNTGLFKSSWGVKQYANVCYVFNNRGAGGIGKGVPLTNVIEYSNRGPNAFIFRTWENIKNEMKETFIKEFERRIK